MRGLSLLLVCLFAFCSLSFAAEKPNLVLLPTEVSEGDSALESSYTNAIAEGLSTEYNVFYGAKVEKQLEKEYDKIDCSAEQCNQNLAIAFNGELIADASVLKIANGYILKLKISNVLSDNIVKSATIPCKGCDAFSVISRLQKMGSGSKKNQGTANVTTSVRPQKQENTRAILIFDSQPSGAKVFIAGKKVGKTPYQGLSHQIGDQLNIRLKSPSHRSYEFKVSLNQAITQLEPIQLEAGQANITVLTEPYTANAVVYVDGQAKGTAPVQITLTTGSHEIYASAEDKKTDVEAIQLNDGDNQQLVLPFNTVSPVLKTLGIEMVDIAAGSFQMGSNDNYDSAKPVHRVNVPAFKMMKYEVTQGQWQAVMGENPSGFDDCGKNCPVESVSWDDIQAFLKKLNQQTGGNFRLPSEAEWEYAARAGTTTKYSWGNDIGSNKANCDGCGSQWDDKSTAPVGSFAPNDFSLHDMHGNVREWTQDCVNGSYSGAPNNGNAWDSGDCAQRVLRGGSWINNPSYLRSANRVRDSASTRIFFNGFRLVQGR